MLQKAVEIATTYGTNPTPERALQAVQEIDHAIIGLRRESSGLSEDLLDASALSGIRNFFMMKAFPNPDKCHNEATVTRLAPRT